MNCFNIELDTIFKAFMVRTKEGFVNITLKPKGHLKM